MDEFNGRIFPSVDGFHDKYFKDKTWSIQAHVFADQVSRMVTPSSSDTFNEDAWDSQPAVTRWFHRLQNLIEPNAQSGFRVQQIPGLRQADRIRLEVLLTPWIGQMDVPPVARIFGEVVLGDDGLGNLLPPPGIGRFFERGRDIFNSCPTRHFLHGFRIYSGAIELWMFDRSGVYSSGPLKLMAGYAMMDRDEVGFSPFVFTDVDETQRLGSTYFAIDKLIPGRIRYYVEDTLCEPTRLFGRGTSCYLASRCFPSPDHLDAGGERSAENDKEEEDAVVKFSWRYEEQHKELVLLRLAQERGAWGVLRVTDWRDLTTIQSLRGGLQFKEPHRLTPDGDALIPVALTEGAQKAGNPFVNKTLSCLVTEPHGRPIYQFHSILELLEAFQDLVRALQSLYQTAGILHRDISLRNVIIPDYPHEVDSDQDKPDNDQDEPDLSGKKGLLIDLDIAHDVWMHPTQPMVGTPGFEAIGALRGDAFTYRHDLESLFYVFLWIAVGHNAEREDPWRVLAKRSPPSVLLGWLDSDLPGVAVTKMSYMSAEGFELVLGEFALEFTELKGLARELRGILFPERVGQMFVGTDMGEDRTTMLYDAMAGAFERAIAEFPGF
ncbi:hypothetical protein B0J18DRAFT_453423 [Chaetomium sp. MPI-SDFR-AT-0129]|nr:hypothetical protein B0J18DRAFT_453423 [Chaetomium sp. MPI-SDFR-AT-0129]